MKAQWSPYRFPSQWESEAWQEGEIQILIKKMTLEILSDVTQKLTMADKVREVHQKSITFELGAIAAGVMERYWRMIRLYRDLADLQAFSANTHDTRTMYDRYAMTRGLYYEIRLEIKLFAEIKEKHESTKPARHVTPAFGQDAAALATFDPQNMDAMDPRLLQMAQRMARRTPQRWSRAPEK